MHVRGQDFLSILQEKQVTKSIVTKFLIQPLPRISQRTRGQWLELCTIRYINTLLALLSPPRAIISNYFPPPTEFASLKNKQLLHSSVMTTRNSHTRTHSPFTSSRLRNRCIADKIPSYPPLHRHRDFHKPGSIPRGRIRLNETVR